MSALDAVVELVKITPKWVEDLAKWLEHEHLSPMLAHAIAGFLLGAVIVLPLIGFVVKFGARVFGQFVKHDNFPTVASTVVFFSTIFPGLVSLSHSPTLFVGSLGPAIPGAYGMKKMAVEMRDNARKKDLPADTPTEAPPTTDVGGLPN
jgi:hypothetical protein